METPGQRSTTALPANAFTRVVREDDVRKDLLFAGTELGLFIVVEWRQRLVAVSIELADYSNNRSSRTQRKLDRGHVGQIVLDTG